jgi:transglutaminase-like putative cysteine protease
MSTAVERYFQVALYLLVLTGFGTLASTGGLGTLPALLVGAAVLFRGFLLISRRELLIPERWTTTLTVAYAAFYLADYFSFSRAFLGSTVHLVLFVLVLRLFSARRDRDYYFLAVIAFLMVLAASVLTAGTTFLLAFTVFMLMAVATVMLMEMRRAAVAASRQCEAMNDGPGARRMGFSLAETSTVLVFLICLLAVAIFFLLPRSSSGYWSAYSPNSEIATGFSDRVQLGRIGEIQQSSSVVMHIQIDGDSHGLYDLKWRGVTLNLFDGRSWSNPHEQRVIVRAPGGPFVLQPGQSAEVATATRSSHIVHYRVLMEPVASSVFFLAPIPLTLDGNYRFVTIDGGSAVFEPDLEHPIGTYQATSNVAQPSPIELRAASLDFPPGVLLNYLQLPRLDPRIPQLASQVTAAEVNNYDKAAAIERYLRTNFGYTLQLPPVSQRDPLAGFLFQRKQGHCEYFASAMAVMLRTLHIPSRVVNGFRTGEFNDLTSQYVVRASNAHSWVEVYFPGFGWISFDPTPSVAVPTYDGWSRAMLYLDAMASFWREWVINYDVSHQRTLGRQATRSGVQSIRSLQDWARREYDAMMQSARQAQRILSDSPGQWSVVGAIAAMLLVFAANAGRLWRAVRRHRTAIHPEKTPRAAATIWYERTVRLLGKRGLRKSRVQTPAEFVVSVADETLRESVAEFTQHYERARFGNSAEDAKRLPELYEEIASSMRK